MTANDLEQLTVTDDLRQRLFAPHDSPGGRFRPPEGNPRRAAGAAVVVRAHRRARVLHRAKSRARRVRGLGHETERVLAQEFLGDAPGRCLRRQADDAGEGDPSLRRAAVAGHRSRLSDVDPGARLDSGQRVGRSRARVREKHRDNRLGQSRDLGLEPSHHRDRRLSARAAQRVDRGLALSEVLGPAFDRSRLPQARVQESRPGLAVHGDGRAHHRQCDRSTGCRARSAASARRPRKPPTTPGRSRPSALSPRSSSGKTLRGRARNESVWLLEDQPVRTIGIRMGYSLALLDHRRARLCRRHRHSS